MFSTLKDDPNRQSGSEGGGTTTRRKQTAAAAAASKQDSAPSSPLQQQLIEEDNEWDGPFMLPVHINGDPIPNYPQILFKFKIVDFTIDLNEGVMVNASNNSNSNSGDTLANRLGTSNEYLSMALNGICIDFAVTKYGMILRACLDDLKLLDRVHMLDNNQGQPTEILSSRAVATTMANENRIIKFYFRQVEPEAPNFVTLYSSILTNVLFDCSHIHVACHRTAIVYFLKYFTGITDNLTISNKQSIPIEIGGELVVPTSTTPMTPMIVIDDTTAKNRPPSFVSAVVAVGAATAATKKPAQSTVTQPTAAAAAAATTTPPNTCELNLIARMNQLTWNMFDTNLTFGEMAVKELSVNYTLCGIKTSLRCQLHEILIDYGKTEVNACYKRIISCTGDGTAKKFFDLSLTLFDTAFVDAGAAKLEQKDFLTLVVGKIVVICLVKFVNELVSFFDPIINPLPAALTEQMKEQAIEKMKSAYQEQQSIGKKIYLNIHISSPQVIIPQSSRSLNGFLVDLGNLNVSNQFLEVISSGGVSVLDQINFSLDNLEIKRVVFENNNSNTLWIKEQLMQPVNLMGELKRTLKNVDTLNIPDLEIKVQLLDLECFVSQKSLKLLFTILNENLNEGNNSDDLAKKNAAVSSQEATKRRALSTIQEEDRLSIGKRLSVAVASTVATTPRPLSSSSRRQSLRTSTIKEESGGAAAAPLDDRLNMKIYVDLKRIKLIIVELTSNKSTNKYATTTTTSVETETSKSDDIPPSEKRELKIRRINNDAYKIINFSHFEIQDIDFDYAKNDNLSWFAIFKMKELHLNDIRPDSNLAVKEMFIPLSKDNFFIVVNYKVDKSQNASLDFTMSHLKINLCLPYILKLYQILMDAIASGSPTTDQQVTKQPPPPPPPKPAAIVEQTADAIVIPAVVESTTTTTPTTTLNVVGIIELPEVILFAEPEKLNSKTLIMNTQVALRFESRAGTTQLEIDLPNLAIRLGENMASSSMRRVGVPFLNPCSAKVSMRQLDAKQPAQYKAFIQSLYLNMTPTMYEVVMGVINTINKTGTETVQKEVEIKRLLEDSEPFVKHKINAEQYNYLNLAKRSPEPEDIAVFVDASGGVVPSTSRTATTTQQAPLPLSRSQSVAVPIVTPPPDEEDAAAAKAAKSKLLETLELAISELYVTFCEESGLDLQPLAIVKMQLNGRASNWTRNLHLKATLSLEASYYNDRLSNWEPLIENCMQREDVYRPWLLSIWFAMEPGGILQPPIDQKGIRDIDFPVQDLDYSVLYKTANVDQQPSANDLGAGLESIASESVLNESLNRPLSQKGVSKKVLKQKKQQQKKMVAAKQAASSTETNKLENRNGPIASYVLIESNDILNINVTPSAYRVIMYLAQITAGTSNKEFLENKVKPPLKFLNFLGERCDLILTNGFALEPENALDFNLVTIDNNRILNETAMSSKKTLEQRSKAHDMRIQKIVEDSQRCQVDSVYNDAYKFRIQIRGFERCKLSMKNDGSYLIPLREETFNDSANTTSSSNENPRLLPDSNAAAIKYNVLFKVRTLYGRTKVILSSPLQVENNSKVKLYILLELTERNMHWKSTLQQELSHYEEVTVSSLESAASPLLQSSSSSSSTPAASSRLFAIIFELLPGKVYYVPLIVAYNFKLFATPNVGKYQPALVFDVRGYNLRIDECSELSCKKIISPVGGGHLTAPINVQVNGNCNVDNDEAVFDNDFYLIRQLGFNVKTHKNAIPAMHANYRVILNTPINLTNCLPLAVRFDVHDQGQRYSAELEPGENFNVHLSASTLRQCKLHISNYLNTSWIGDIDWLEFTEFKQETLKLDMRIAPTTEMQVSGKHLRVYVSYKKPNEYIIYSPYWLVNKSGQPIKIKASDTQRVFDIPDDCILFYDYKTVDKNNKVKMAVRNGRWSDAFSLETAGTTGMIQCKDENKTYNFLMRITMSNSSRSKLITFAPFLSIANQLDHLILIREWHKNHRTVSNYDWKPIEPIDIIKKPVSYWPNFTGESKQVCFVIKTPQGYETQPFPLENPGRFVLMVQNPSLDQSESNFNENTTEDAINQYKILSVLISGGNQNPVTIVIRKYQYGDSVAKLVNLCAEHTISLRQMNSDLAWQLEPMREMYFVWPDLIKSTRELQWSLADSIVQTSWSSSAAAQHYEPIKLTKSGNDKYRFMVPAAAATDNQSGSARIYNNNDSDLNDDTNNLLLTSTYSPTTYSPQGPSTSAAAAAQQLLPVEVSCVSYVDATQRVIVFTTDLSLAEFERKKESSSMEIFMSVRGLAVSLINNVNLEIATVSIKESTAPVWSLLVADTEVKTFTSDYSAWLEHVYTTRYLARKSFVDMATIYSIIALSTSETDAEDDGGEKFEIDFKNMQLLKPERGQLKREYAPGLDIQYRTSANMTSLKCRVFNFQIDNQLPDAYFPISFYRSTKNRSLVPFVSVSLFSELQEVTQIYRYFDCILQEFYLKMDKGFLLSVKDWYDAAIETSSKDNKSFDLSGEDMREIHNYIFIVDQDKYLLEKMTDDLKLTKEIMEYANQAGSVKQSAHIRFDDFHLSPMIFNLSFSVNGTAHTDDKEVTPGTADTILNFFLESIGATITEFKDVKFRFKPFSITDETITWKELYDDIFDHYKIQSLHQAYVLILGLDVLGNPFGLVSDFSQGLTDLFYDPLLGYLYNKEPGVGKNRNGDDAEAMTRKVRETVNQTISSVAGSGSLITGSIGRVLATCTFDQEYKKKRQYKLSKLTTTSLPESITIACKGVLSGLVYGLSGVVNKPIEEKRVKGIKGVFTGLGKGTIGFFAKPTGSLFDGVSLCLDSLKRVSKTETDAITNVRLPRHLINDVAILPYSEYQAEGYEILRDLHNDDIALDESYWAHISVETKAHKYLLFITDRKIFKLKKTRTQILNKWKVLDKPISLNKIQQVKFEALNWDALNALSKQARKREINELPPTATPANTKDKPLYRLYVYVCDDSSLGLGRRDDDEAPPPPSPISVNSPELQLDENMKYLLIASDLETCHWISDKINSAIRYNKELKNIINIF